MLGPCRALRVPVRARRTPSRAPAPPARRKPPTPEQIAKVVVAKLKSPVGMPDKAESPPALNPSAFRNRTVDGAGEPGALCHLLGAAGCQGALLPKFTQPDPLSFRFVPVLPSA